MHVNVKHQKLLSCSQCESLGFLLGNDLRASVFFLPFTNTTNISIQYVGRLRLQALVNNHPIVLHFSYGQLHFRHHSISPSFPPETESQVPVHLPHTNSRCPRLATAVDPINPVLVLGAPPSARSESLVSLAFGTARDTFQTEAALLNCSKSPGFQATAQYKSQ